VGECKAVIGTHTAHGLKTTHCDIGIRPFGRKNGKSRAGQGRAGAKGRVREECIFQREHQQAVDLWG